MFASIFPLFFFSHILWYQLPKSSQTFYIFLHFISSYSILFLFPRQLYFNESCLLSGMEMLSIFPAFSFSLILRCREHLEFRVVLAQSDWFLNSVLLLLYPPGCFSDNRTDMLGTELQLKCLL